MKEYQRPGVDADCSGGSLRLAPPENKLIQHELSHFHRVAVAFVRMARLQKSNSPRQDDSRDQREGKSQPIVRMELHLGQQIAQRNADENSGGRSQRSADDQVLILAQMIDPQNKGERTEWAHQRDPQVDEISRGFLPAARRHQTGNRKGIERLVQQNRQKDAKSE